METGLSMNFNWNKPIYYPTRSKWIFLFLLLVVSLIYNYHSILFRPPGVIHQWRQCDCLSLAANYYHFGMDFFQPAVYFCGNETTGATASEFPIIYYFVAFLWKLFGKHEIIFRLVNLSIVYCGLFYLFRFIEERLKDSFWAILLSLLVFTSPIYVYYSNGFIMDPLGLSIAFIAWYFFGKFYDSGNNKFLLLSLLFFLFAGLLKVSSSISLFAILAIYFFELIGIKFRDGAVIFNNKKKQIIPFLIVGLLLYSWYSYAARYNDLHGSGVFLVGILPYWNYDAAAISGRILNFKGEMTLHQFFNIESIYLIFALFLAQFALIRKSSLFYISINILLFFATCAFLVLWFGAVTEGHDYYLINLLIFVVFTFLSFFLQLQRVYPKIFSAAWMKLLFTIILIYNIQLTSAKTSIRYFNTKPQNYPSCYSGDNVKRMQWAKYHFSTYFEPIRDISPYLRSIGIQPNDLVISLPDYSFDITLYFMNQKGWTAMSAPNPLTEEWFLKKIEQGAKYLIINEPVIYSEKAIQRFVQHKIGRFKNLDVYDLRKLPDSIRLDLNYDLEKPEMFPESNSIKSIFHLSGQKAAFFTSAEEYGLIIHHNPKDYADLDRMHAVEISFNCFPLDEDYKGSLLVFQIKNSRDSVLLYQTINIDLKKSSSWQEVKSEINIRPLVIQPDYKIDAFLWNSQKKNIAIDDIKISYKGYKFLPI